MGSEYVRQRGKQCGPGKYGKFRTLDQAKRVCNICPKCQGVMEYGCNGGTYYLCPIFSELETSDSACVYAKSNRKW